MVNLYPVINDFFNYKNHLLTMNVIFRMEDITDPELLAKDSLCNRRVCLYGYARGGALKKDSVYHIPGKYFS